MVSISLIATQTSRRAFSAAIVAAASIFAFSYASYAQDTTLRMWTFLNPAGNAGREKALAEIIRKFETARLEEALVCCKAHSTGSARHEGALP